jgi:DNA-binding MarR family transcriptional regulator
MNPETFATSREALAWCIEHGVISTRVADVLRALVEADGPMNQTMTHSAVVRITGNLALSKYSVSPRFAVLERMGLIRETGSAPCPISGRSTVFYEATSSRPTCTEGEAMASADRKETMRALKLELAEVTKERDQLRELLQLRSASHAAREKRIRETPVPVQTFMFG